MAKRITVKEAKEWAAIVGRDLGKVCYPEYNVIDMAWCYPYMEHSSRVIGQERAEAAMLEAYTVAKIEAQEHAQDALY